MVTMTVPWVEPLVSRHITATLMDTVTTLLTIQEEMRFQEESLLAGIGKQLTIHLVTSIQDIGGVTTPHNGSGVAWHLRKASNLTVTTSVQTKHTHTTQALAIQFA